MLLCCYAHVQCGKERNIKKGSSVSLDNRISWEIWLNPTSWSWSVCLHSLMGHKSILSAALCFLFVCSCSCAKLREKRKEISQAFNPVIQKQCRKPWFIKRLYSTSNRYETCLWPYICCSVYIFIGTLITPVNQTILVNHQSLYFRIKTDSSQMFQPLWWG